MGRQGACSFVFQLWSFLLFFVLFVFGHPYAESLKKVSTGVVCI